MVKLRSAQNFAQMLIAFSAGSAATLIFLKWEPGPDIIVDHTASSILENYNIASPDNHASAIPGESRLDNLEAQTLNLKTKVLQLEAENQRYRDRFEPIYQNIEKFGNLGAMDLRLNSNFSLNRDLALLINITEDEIKTYQILSDDAHRISQEMEKSAAKVDYLDSGEIIIEINLEDQEVEDFKYAFKERVRELFGIENAQRLSQVIDSRFNELLFTRRISVVNQPNPNRNPIIKVEYLGKDGVVYARSTMSSGSIPDDLKHLLQWIDGDEIQDTH